ncbi:MAG: fasciclin domain-containing protein [Caulobacteraceae bacterium]
MTIRIDHRLARAGVLSLALFAMAAPSAFAQMAGQAMPDQTMSDPMVGGAAMYPSKTIVENAVNSKDHTTLVAAVKAAGLVDTLSGTGPFTVFAPTNEAFAKLPAGTVDTLVKPENKPELTKILTYHVVAGRLTAMDLMKMVKDGGGTATLTTVQGEPLTVTQKGRHLMVRDAKGDVARVTIGDVYQSNGVIHVVDTVLLPN